MEEVDSIVDQSDQIVTQEKSLETQLSYLATQMLTGRLSPTAQNVALVKMLLQQLQNMQKELEKNDQKEKDLQKGLKQALQALMQNLTSRNSINPSQTQQLAKMLNQLTVLMSELQHSDQQKHHVISSASSCYEKEQSPIFDPFEQRDA